MSLELETLLHEIRALGDPIPQAKVLALLRSQAGQRIYFAHSALVRPERVRLARAMLQAGMARPDIMRALVERLRVSEATAYRLITEALDESRPHMRQVDMFR